MKKRADLLLVEKNFAETRSKAQSMIMAGQVSVNGKNITKSTIIAGNVPVVAGGLNPAYYHNTSNTINPVITVSASGANAGYVNIYLEDIWASDCSYIDSNLSDSVFFIHSLILNQQDMLLKSQKHTKQKFLVTLLMLHLQP